MPPEGYEYRDKYDWITNDLADLQAKQDKDQTIEDSIEAHYLFIECGYSGMYHDLSV